jgi:serine/threonine protein phosphatase PrpC
VTAGSIIEWGAAGWALDGTPEASGDRHVVVPTDHGVLVAVIDGLGHGPEAAIAAERAVEIIEAYAEGPPLAVLQHCHAGLRKTRGVVLTLAALDGRVSSMSWVGVGDVEGVLLRADPLATPPSVGIATRGGVVGYMLPPLRVTELSVSEGDTLVLATDGIARGFSASLDVGRSPQELAELILARHRRGSDDALVLVARYLGKPSDGRQR